MTNTVLTITNSGPITINIVVGPVSSNEPLASSSEYWDVAIMFVSPAVVWAIGRYFPKLPKAWLPLITPVVGILAGLGINIFTNAHLGWWAMAKAGMLAVFVREVTNQTITKSLQNRLSGKTEETPSSTPVASSAPTAPAPPGPQT